MVHDTFWAYDWPVTSLLKVFIQHAILQFDGLGTFNFKEIHSNAICKMLLVFSRFDSMIHNAIKPPCAKREELGAYM